MSRAAVLGAVLLIVALSSVVAYSPAFASDSGQYCATYTATYTFGDPPTPVQVVPEDPPDEDKLPAICILVSYYDVATSVMPSAAGYGGLGHSGGAGDALLRIVNPNHNDAVQNGTLCAMIYVFDDNEEMQACCGCPVTPDGLRTMSVINQLTTNWGFNKGNLAAGVIDILSMDPDWVAPFPGAPPPRGVNVAGSSGVGCDPSLGVGSQTDESTIGGPELRAWMDHTESMVGAAAPFTGVVSTSTDELRQTPADLHGEEVTHAEDLIESCGFLLSNGSGSGVCSCGAGDNYSAFRPHS
ncbi:MAG: hypothetical protein WA005_08310 [Candidatus Binataceae bacterium]